MGGHSRGTETKKSFFRGIHVSWFHKRRDEESFKKGKKLLIEFLIFLFSALISSVTCGALPSSWAASHSFPRAYLFTMSPEKIRRWDISSIFFTRGGRTCTDPWKSEMNSAVRFNVPFPLPTVSPVGFLSGRQSFPSIE